jgi:Tfp pilus assembly PilM family ATPase
MPNLALPARTSGRLIALEWDSAEVRLVVGSRTGKHAVLRQALRMPLARREEGEKEEDHAGMLAESIRALLRQAGARNARLLIGVNRQSIDLRQLTLPPCPDDELPDLVRNQALREFGPSIETSRLDFVPLPALPGEPRVVIAAALAPEASQFIDRVCEQAGLKPARLLARPYAAGSVLLEQAHGDKSSALLVEAHNEEANLTVVADQQVIFSRAARLTSSVDAEHPAPLIAEIKRTLIAVQNQPPGDRVERIYLCGDPDEVRDLAGRLHEELDLPVDPFDPFHGFDLADDLRQELPPQRGRFVSLLGMMGVEARGQKHALDFLHPRKPPAPERLRKRQLTALGVVLGVLALLGSWVAYSSFSTINVEIEQLTKQSKELDDLVKKAQQKQVQVAAIDEWKSGEVIWIDEMRDLSARFPNRRDAILLRLTLGRAPGGGGLIELQGLVRDPTIVGRLESQLRDDHHEVRSKRVQENIQEKTFTWQFESSLAVSPRSKEDYLASANVKGPRRDRIHEEYGPNWDSQRPKSTPAATTPSPLQQDASPAEEPAGVRAATRTRTADGRSSDAAAEERVP